MNLLLDTHALLWWLDDDPDLSKTARDAVADGRNLVLVSAASIWEIGIKRASGKLVVPADFRDVLSRQPFLFLDITAEHAHAVSDLPLHHRDPFDRMLIAQASMERLTIITRDDLIKQYDIPVIDA